MRLGLALVLSCVWTTSVQAADWREAKWPFARDAWPAGRAWACAATPCSGNELVISRVKLGFCNCETGVRDDAEVDYVSDMDLVSQNFEPLSDGQSINLFGLAGRVRLYRYPAGQNELLAMGIALSRKCDVVAVSVMGLSSEQTAKDVLDLVARSASLRDFLATQLGERL